MSDVFSLAVIPARGGSKRIPRKNIRPFAGKPVIAYSISAAREAGCFSDIVVSTDDEEIAAIARAHGGNVPFMRSARTSGDQAGLAEVVQEVINSYEAAAGKTADLVCCVLPAAPLVSARDILDGYRRMLTQELNALITVVPYEYPVERALRARNGFVSMIAPENYVKMSQDCEPTYHDAGQFYWIRKDALFRHGRLFVPQTGFILVDPLRAQDIDTEDDWRFAEIKYKALRHE